jgi:amino acid adenylation domain-containing protein
MRYLLHDTFIDSVKKYPDNVAVVDEAGGSISYTELNNLSNKFSNFFMGLKGSIRENPFVGVLSPVGVNSIAAIFGALKIGCAYVPLDRFSPTERLAKIVENTSLDVLVLDPYFYAEHKDLLDNSNIKKFILLGTLEDAEKHPKAVSFESIEKTVGDEPDVLNQVSDDLAYILHSSGSTGVPKGIMLTHRNARTFIDWMQKEFMLTPEDVVMSRAPFKFDLSVFDIFNTFNAGAKLVCFDWNKDKMRENKHSDYVKLMSKEKVTMLYTTPSTFISLMNKGSLAEHNLNLRTVMYAGEPFPPAQVRKLMEVLPKTKIANIYGPTETNIITYYWINKVLDDDSPIPLGDVVDDTEIIIVSEDGSHICKSEEIGELWCRGGTVTLGYLGMEEKTREAYVQSPFHKYPVFFWRTGDYGFRDKDGVLHYRGRKDHMVKVKGFRIELGEIENALAAHPGIDEFVVVAIPDEKYGNRLYCYYSLLSSVNTTTEDIKEFLMSKLPEYMLPYRFIQLDVLPKTSSGKIDRVLLAQELKDRI